MMKCALANLAPADAADSSTLLLHPHIHAPVPRFQRAFPSIFLTLVRMCSWHVVWPPCRSVLGSLALPPVVRCHGKLFGQGWLVARRARHASVGCGVRR